MRRGLWIPLALAVLGLAVYAASAGATPATGTGKLGYTEIVAADGTLTVSVDESGQKRFTAVDYRLGADVSVTARCVDQAVAGFYSLSATASGLSPDAKGHVLGSIGVTPPLGGSGCSGILSRTFDYTNVTLTNVASGHLYRLDPISETYS